MPLLRVRCLGGLDISYRSVQDGLLLQADDCETFETITLPATAKAQSLLAYLIINRGNPQPRERLTDIFWPDGSPRKARRSLSTALWQIRCILPFGTLSRYTQTVQFTFAGPIVVDSEEFIRCISAPDAAKWERAIALYRGAFLAGFYDDWILEQRYHLQTRFEETLRKCMHHAADDGRLQVALDTASRLLEQSALHEAAHRLIMRVRAVQGERQAALRQYHLCRNALQKELNIDPAAETTALYQAILSEQYPPYRYRPDRELPVNWEKPTPVFSGAESISAQQPLSLLPFAGRKRELAILHDAFPRRKTSATRASDSFPVSFVLITGAAGIGKSRLVTEFAETISGQTGLVLWGRCYEFERLLPYQPLIDVLRAQLSSLTADASTRLPRWIVAELARLLPEIIEHDPTISIPVAIDPEQEQVRLFQAIAGRFAQLSSAKPLLIIVEDLHWATPSTLQLLHYLARTLREQHVLFVATCRTEAVLYRSDLDRFLRQLTGCAWAKTLSMPPLTGTAVVEIIQALAGVDHGSRSLAERLHQEAAGNPFYLTELLKTLFASGQLQVEQGRWRGDFAALCAQTLPLPPTMRELILARIQQLPPETQSILTAAAVIGRKFDFNVLNAVVQSSAPTMAILPLLDDLLRHKIISECAQYVDHDYAFSHHSIQEVLYAEIGAHHRHHLHATIAATIEKLYCDAIDDRLSELAFHYEQAVQADAALREKAYLYLWRAGETAAAQFANQEALDYLERAQRLVQDGEQEKQVSLLLARERLYDLQGDRTAQLDALTALREVPILCDEPRRAAIALRYARYAQITGEYTTAETMAREAIRLAEISRDRRAVANGYLLLGQIFWRQGDNDEAHEFISQSLQIWQAMGDRKGMATALHSLGQVLRDEGNYAAAQTHLEESLSIFRQIHEQLGCADALYDLGVLALLQSNYAVAQTQLQESLVCQRVIGNQRGIGWSLHYLGLLMFEQGNLYAAKTYFEKSLEIDRALDDQQAIAWTLNNLGMVVRTLGDLERAQNFTTESLQIKQALGDKRGVAWSLTTLGLLASQQGKYAAAQTYLEKSLRMRQLRADRHGIPWALLHLGMVCRYQGDYEKARTYILQAQKHCKRLNMQAGVAWSQYHLGLVALDESQLSAAQSHLETSLTAFRSLQAEDAVAWVLCYLGVTKLTLHQLDEASDCCYAGLHHMQQVGDQQGIAHLLEAFVGLAVAKSLPTHALQIAGAVAALRTRLDSPCPPAEHQRLTHWLDRARQALPSRSAAAIYAQGERMSVSQAITSSKQI